MNLPKLLCCVVFALPAFVVAEEPVAQYELTLQSADYQSRRARFKLYDASSGCPSYNDLPGAKAYLGSLKVSAKGAVKTLPADIKIHVFYFMPRNTPEITAKGGAKEIRRRSAQIVLTGAAAKLELVQDETGQPQWIGSGSVTVESAVNCNQSGAE